MCFILASVNPAPNRLSGIEESVNNICGENTLTKVSLNNRGIFVDFFLSINRV